MWENEDRSGNDRSASGLAEKLLVRMDAAARVVVKLLTAVVLGGISALALVWIAHAVIGG